jgi:glycosyltransferase involved in cell wall biosynthesis
VGDALRTSLKLLCDARAIGPNGIGRFAKEVLDRLPQHARLTHGPGLFSPVDPIWQAVQISRFRPDIYFSPRYNPPASCTRPFVFTIHDLIHLRVPEERSAIKRLYYEHIVKPAIWRAKRVVTVSEYSRRQILEWSGVAETRVVVVGNGVSQCFSPLGPRADFGYKYLLYVGNRKPHKNVGRLLDAFKKRKDPTLTLVFTGLSDGDTKRKIRDANLEHRVTFAGEVSEPDMPKLYRGAEALVIPSIMEGFGLPALEAMACGTPALVARSSSLPEVVGDAAEFFDPYDVDDMSKAIDRVLDDEGLRLALRVSGLAQASLFTWDRVADRLSTILEA